MAQTIYPITKVDGWRITAERFGRPYEAPEGDNNVL